MLFAEQLAQLAQAPVDAALDGGELLPGQAGDLGHGQVGAVTQGDRFALLLAQLRLPPPCA